MSAESIRRVGAGTPDSGRTLHFLRFGETTVPVTAAGVLIGRDVGCAVVLADARASRRHARVSLREQRVLVEDLGSANGVFVAGERVAGKRWLAAGDVLLIGTSELELVLAEKGATSGTVTRHEHTATVEELGVYEDDDDFDAPQASRTRKVEALVLFGEVADKMLAAGQVAAAEQILAPRLTALLVAARASEPVEPLTAQTAGAYAVKLAAAKLDPGWVDYLFELCAVLGVVLPVALVDELYALVRRLPPIKLGLVRDYVGVLGSVTLGPADRFVVQRLNGLIQLAASRPRHR